MNETIDRVIEVLIIAKRAGSKLRVSQMRGEGGRAMHTNEFDELIAADDIYDLIKTLRAAQRRVQETECSSSK